MIDLKELKPTKEGYARLLALLHEIANRQIAEMSPYQKGRALARLNRRAAAKAVADSSITNKMENQSTMKQFNVYSRDG